MTQESITTEFILVHDPPKIIERLSEPISARITGRPPAPPSYDFADHIQGAAFYNEHMIFTHNGPGVGYFAIVERGSGKVSSITENPTPEYSHPGGCQVAGNFLAVSWETAEEGKTGSVITLYDITDPFNPIKLPYGIDRDNAKATDVAMVQCDLGGTKYVVAAVEGRSVDFYYGDPKRGFSNIGKESMPLPGGEDNPQNIALVIDTDLELWMCVFSSTYFSMDSDAGSAPPEPEVPTREDNLGFSYKDNLYLYRLGKAKDIRFPASESIVKHFDFGRQGPFGVHFRWGAGIRAISPSALEVCATERELDAEKAGWTLNVMTSIGCLTP